MPFEVTMPKMGYADESTIDQWLVGEGEYVEKDAPLLLINTDKSTIEVEAPASGYLHIIAPAGVTVPVDNTIAVLYETASAESTQTQKKESRYERVFVTPAARALARRQGIEIERLIQEVGKEKIGIEDVEAAIGGFRCRRKETRGSDSCAEGRVQVIPLTGTRKTIGQRLMQSLRESAQVTAITEADVTRLAELREQACLSRECQRRVSWNALFIKAMTQAINEHPLPNSRLVDGQIQVSLAVNVGIAVDTDSGLLVPVVQNVERLSLLELDNVLADRIEKARAGALNPSDMQGGTITFTNSGMYEVDFFTPILNLPQSAIVGIGRIRKAPRVIDDTVVVRSVVYISLTYDHRVLDGAEAARFLTTFKHILEDCTYASLAQGGG